jgi:hypothetical protein
MTNQNMRISGLFVSLLCLSACKSDKEKLIIGKWNAAQLVECEEVVPINTSLVNLEFKDNGTYVFNSTLNVHEEGKFRISNEYLYTQDKLKTNAGEKAVFIKSISTDSLVLQMSYKGKDQWLTLMKEGVTIMKDNTVDLKDIVEQKKQDLDSFYSENKLITENKVQDLEKMGTPNASSPAGEAASAIAAGKMLTEALKPKAEVKKAEKEPEKKFDTKEETYAKREALRKKEEAKQKEDERRRYENYMDRERDRKREEAKRKAAKKK